MTTVTKIKGVINNPLLPVLTENGLETFYVGKYLNLLNSAGGSITQSQKEAIQSFTDAIVLNGLDEYITSMFPFIASNSNLAGAGVPLFGDKPIAFSGDYAGFVIENNNLIGINRSPADPNFKLKDIQPDVTFCGAAFSSRKNASTVAQLDRFFTFGSQSVYQVRMQSTVISGNVNTTMRFYVRRPDGTYDTIQLYNPIEQSNNACNVYFGAFIKNNQISRLSGRYVAAAGLENFAVVEDSNLSSMPSMLDSDLEQSIAATEEAYQLSTALTSITFFSKPLSREQLPTYMRLLKSFMIALDRDN